MCEVSPIFNGSQCVKQQIQELFNLTDTFFTRLETNNWLAIRCVIRLCSARGRSCIWWSVAQYDFVLVWNIMSRSSAVSSYSLALILLMSEHRKTVPNTVCTRQISCMTLADCKLRSACGSSSWRKRGYISTSVLKTSSIVEANCFPRAWQPVVVEYVNQAPNNCLYHLTHRVHSCQTVIVYVGNALHQSSGQYIIPVRCRRV